jgi:N-acetyltransferase
MPFPPALTAPVLEGRRVRLEPLTHQHAASLAAAASENRDSYAFTWVPDAAEVGSYIDEQLGRAAAGSLMPYAQVEVATGRAVGATAYWDPRLWPDGADLMASRSASPGWPPRRRAPASIPRPNICCSGTPSSSGEWPAWT